MSIARDRANRSGTDPVFLNNTNVGNCWIEQMFSDKPVKPPPI